MAYHEPTSVTIEKHGNSIDVTLSAKRVDPVTPPKGLACMESVIDPLPSGVYAVNLLLRSPSASFPEHRTLLTSKTLEVSGQPAPPPNHIPCPNGLGSFDYFGISPSPADSTQAIRVAAGLYSAVPKSLSIEVHGNTVDVTLSADYTGYGPSPPTDCIDSAIDPLPSGVYTVKLHLYQPSSPQLGLSFLTSKTLEVSGPPAALSGLWWNPSESGWGINFTQRGSNVFAVWYTYDAAGNPKWYFAPHCELPAATASGHCVETLYEVNGPKFFGSPFNPAAAHISDVGTMSLTFNDENSGSMTYTVAGQTRTVAIGRQPLPSGSTPPPVNYTDLWWNPDESGWGIAVTHQYGVMFLAWFVYDSAGKPVWYVASNCNVKATQDGCDGILYRTTGPALGPTFDSSQVRATAVGTVSLTFPDSNNATLSYTVDGVGSTKTIKRQVF